VSYVCVRYNQSSFAFGYTWFMSWKQLVFPFTERFVGIVEGQREVRMEVSFEPSRVLIYCGQQLFVPRGSSWANEWFCIPHAFLVDSVDI
jgi:hypothetical protein